jgi:hypothetical protein
MIKTVRMKKTSILLLSLSVATAAFAQTETQKEEAKRVILGGKKETSTPAPAPKTGDGRTVILGGDRDVYGENRTSYPTSNGSTREQRINEINRDYDAKIRSIRFNRTLSPAEKERIIRQLEAERRRKINAVNGEYNGNTDGDDNRYKKNKKGKGNKGNHYGWQKGKGNPHRSR